MSFRKQVDDDCIIDGILMFVTVVFLRLFVKEVFVSSNEGGKH